MCGTVAEGNNNVLKIKQRGLWNSTCNFQVLCSYRKILEIGECNGSALVFRKTTRRYTTISIQIPINLYTGPASVVGQT